MGRRTSIEQPARAADRPRRIALHRDRAARDEGAEAAAAQGVLALGERDDAACQVPRAEPGVGDALQPIVGEGVNVNGAAAFCELFAGDVQRFRPAAQDLGEPRGNAAPTGARTVRSPDVKVRGLNDVADDASTPKEWPKLGRDEERRGPQARDVAERVRASMSAQGLPERVEDPDILMAVAAAIIRARQSTPSAHRIGSHARNVRPDVPAPQLPDSRAS